MKPNRKNTQAIKYLMDEITSPEDFITASPEKVGGYLTAKGVKLAELDTRMAQFLGRLGGKMALAQAAREQPTTPAVETRRAEISKMSDAEILARLVAKWSCQNQVSRSSIIRSGDRIRSSHQAMGSTIARTFGLAASVGTAMASGGAAGAERSNARFTAASVSVSPAAVSACGAIDRRRRTCATRSRSETPMRSGCCPSVRGV